MNRLELNQGLSNYAMKILSMYLDFPKDEPITAVDFRARDGKLLETLTDKHKELRHLYGVEESSYLANQIREKETFEKVSTSKYNSEKRITKDAFSLAIVDPFISPVVRNEIFDTVDAFVEPNFEVEEKERLTQKESDFTFDEIDFSEDELTEEEKDKQEKAFNKKLEKSIKNRKVAYRRALREQEKRISFERSDNYLLRVATDHLMPGGVLVMITPKELVDTSITLRLGNRYEDIQILRVEEDEYMTTRKCIILARKKKNTGEQDRSIGYTLAETKLTPFKEIPEIEPQVEPTYHVPAQSNDVVGTFRVGPLTGSEVLDAIGKSNLLETYQESYAQVLTDEDPITPTPLHKGHIMLLLTSGYLNGYIGKGVNQHLVKGNAIKMTRETIETDDEGNEITKEKDFYNISVKYLNSRGEFHKLM